MARLVPAPAHQGLKFYGHGTRVTVNDLFGNLPVRVKSRALALQKPDELEREWDHLRHLLVSLTLANAKLRKLVLEDPRRSRKITIRSRAQPSLSSSQGAELDIQRINSVLAQANLVGFQDSESWNTVSGCISNISIRAAISLVPSPTKKVQFISFGRDPLFLVSNTNILYDEVNRLFSLSDFGAIGAAAEHPAGTKSPAHWDEQGDIASKGPSKAINRWPMFYIRIDASVPQRLYDDSYELVPGSDKSIQHIMDVLTAMVNEFLEQHNLRPRAVKRQRKAFRPLADPISEDRKVARRTRCTKVDGPVFPVSTTEDTLDGNLRLPPFRKATSTRSSQGFGTWSRVKGSATNAKNTHVPRTKEEPDSVEKKHLSSHPYEADSEILANNGSRMRDTFTLTALPEKNGNYKSEEAQQAENASPQDPADVMIPWTDPYTGKSHLINARTGQSMRPDSRTLSLYRPRSTGSIQPMRYLNGMRRPASAIPSRAQNIWVENLLKGWDNPALRRPERPISSAGVEPGHENACGKSIYDGLGDSFSLDGAGYAKFRGKLRRQHLAMAEVIAQVDRKFIFVKTTSTRDTGNSDSDDVLALIDQHAADERCRVEQLFEELFVSGDEGIDMKTFTDPIAFEVNATEAPLFKRYTKFFYSWGVDYSIDHKPGFSIGLGTINSLPSLIAERCRTEPGLAVDFIRNEIWKREESGQGPYEPSLTRDKRQDGGPGHTWVEHLSGCPQGIIDLLNSRACRSSIMFNDVLTIDECQNLVARLARCVFPFQCAHGRPSLVPILDLQSIGTEDWSLLNSADDLLGCETTAARKDFVDAFRTWRDTNNTLG